MRRSPTRVLGRVVLSCGAMAVTAWLLSNGPYMATGRRVSSTPAMPKPAKDPAGPAQDLTISGLPIQMKESQIAPCDAATWDPFAAGYCQGACTRVGERREGSSARFAWFEEAGRLQALNVECGAGGSPGKVSQISILSAAGLEGLTLPLAGPRQPRTGPVPALPGSAEVASLRSGAMTFLIDRPDHPRTAIEELQLALLSTGWHRIGDPAAKPPENAPPTRVFMRGTELCIVTLDLQGEDPYLISAYSRDGWAPEVFR